MRKYRLTLVFAIDAIVFTVIATLTENRILIAVLFLVLLAFIAISDATIQRSRKRELNIVEARLAERQKAEKELSERAIALEAVNKELEAFSYSVSHDLRSPLRSIDGFSLALLEDYADKLDDEGKDYLIRVRNASQRMAQLIDDLLQLSRLTRKEMQRESVDLTSLAKAVASNLQRNQPDRDTKFVIEEGMTTNGDSKLLQVLLENLMGNAWKFTGKKSTATIELNSQGNNEKSVYYIKDDGAGFDMEYSEKLFGAFQRLHGANEFEGTGIGLATVQRIVTRHGGKIWAEGAINQGATFYFTLQPQLEMNHD
ncbi:MAG: ATP-binding protein [Chloroflexi bacterium]|nr:ATP-binding protein [Chloroflexota bacterium]